MLDFLIGSVIAVLALLGLIGLYLLWRRYRALIIDFFRAVRDGERIPAGVFWSVLSLIYIGLLVLGSKLGWKNGELGWANGGPGWDNFMLSVGVGAALAARIGKNSIDRMMGSDKAHEIPVISLLVVAIFTWIWPSAKTVAVLPFVLTSVWALNAMPDRWTQFRGELGRKVVFYGTAIAVALVVSWSLFRFTFPELAPSIGTWVRSSEAALAQQFRTTRLRIHWKSSDKPVLAKTSATAVTPSSQEASETQPASGPKKTTKTFTWNGQEKIYDLTVASGRLPYPDEVVNGKVSPVSTTAPSSVQAPPAPAAAPKTDDELLSAMRQRFGE